MIMYDNNDKGFIGVIPWIIFAFTFSCLRTFNLNKQITDVLRLYDGIFSFDPIFLLIPLD